MARGDLTDMEWRIIEGLLPTERGRKSRPAHDNRQYLNGMLHVLRVGCPWRDMHERYGKWNSVYVRFRRWAEQGVWDALLETLVELGLTDSVQMTGMVAPSDTALYYKAADFFISASTSETQGLTFLESLATGTPIIAHSNP